MDWSQISRQVDAAADVLRLRPQIVGRFYGDGNRLGQRPADAPAPAYYSPERWIGSSTEATNPPGIPSGGISTCLDIRGDGEGELALRDLLAHAELGPRLLGEPRHKAHDGALRVLIKLLDARLPIPFHVHATDDFVATNPNVYPRERFGKDEAYHYLDVPKGDCPYTHIGVYPGVGAGDVVSALRRGTDHVIELTPGALQRFGEGFIVRAGMLHRPGTALTLEIQQPSDVYTMFQTDFGGAPLPPEAMHPGFDSIDAAAEAVVDWQANTAPDPLDNLRLTPRPVTPTPAGGSLEWVYPPEASDKFSGMRLKVTSTMKFTAQDPCILYIWRGEGTLDGLPVRGGAGPVGENDEFFLGHEAVRRGIEITTTGEEPLVAFALFAAAV